MQYFLTRRFGGHEGTVKRFFYFTLKWGILYKKEAATPSGRHRRNWILNEKCFVFLICPCHAFEHFALSGGMVVAGIHDAGDNIRTH
jgi:hypothetical protein